MLRPSEIIAMATQEGLDPAYALAAYDMESSGGADPAAGTRGFQVQETAFRSVLPNGNIDDERDQALAGIRYLKQGKAVATNDAEVYAFYHAGPKWQQKLAKNPELMDEKGGKTVEKSNAFSKRVDYWRAQLASGDTSTSASGAPLSTGKPEEFSPEKLYKQLQRDLLSAMNVTSGAIARFQTETKTLQGEYAKTIDEIVQAVSAGSGAAQTKILADASVEAKLGLEASDYLTKLGINTSDVDNVAARIATRMNTIKDQTDQLAAVIEQKSSVSFLQDPLGWIGAQLTIGDDIQQHNALNRQFRKDARDAAALTAVSDAVNRSNKAKKGMLESSAAQAAADALKFQAVAEAGKVKLLGMQYNQTLLGQELTRLNQQTQMFQTAAMALQLSENREHQAQAKEAEAAAKNAEFEGAQLAAKQLGITLSSPKELDRLPMPLKIAIKKIQLSGGTDLGKTPLEAFETIKLGNPKLMPVYMQSMAEFLYIAKGQAEKKLADDPTAKMLSAEAKVGAVNIEITKLYNEWQDNVLKNPVDGRNSNPYRAMPAQELVKDPEIMKTRIGQILEKTLKDNPAFKIDDRQVLNLAKEAFVTGGTYNSLEEVGKDIQSYFTRAVKINNETYRFENWRLPAQERYRFAPEEGARPADMLKYADIMTWLIKRTAKDISYGAMQEMPGANTFGGVYGVAP